MYIIAIFTPLILIYLCCVDQTVGDIDGNFTCEERWSCKTYKYLHLDITDFNQQFDYFKVMNCYCDTLCILFNDCCLDAETKPNSLPRQLGDISLKSMSCVRLKEVSETNSIYIINECPPTWHGQKVRSLCEEYNSDDVMLRLPVTGHDTGLMYKNMYCAICHQITFSYWIPSVFCTHVPKIRRAENLTIQDIVQDKKCKVLFLPPHKDIHFRPCLGHAITDTCDPTYIDIDTMKLCEQTDAMQMVYSVLGAWKNVNCAVCNYQTDIHCRHEVLSGSPITKDPVLRFYVFSILLNLNTGTGSTSLGLSTKYVHKNVTYACQNGEVFDPFISRCRSIVSDDGTMHENAQYLENQTTVNVNFTDCIRVELNETEYVLLGNDSLLQLSVRKVLDKTQYYLRGTVAVVCTDLIQNYTQDTVVDERIAVTFSRIEGIITVTGLSVSLLALLATIIIYSAFKPLQNTPGKNLLSLCCSLFVAESLMIVAPFVECLPILCKGVAMFMHYFFLAAFFWMNVIAADIWATFSNSYIQTRVVGKSFTKLCCYCIYAWGVPAIIMVVSLLVNYLILDSSFKPDYGNGICWLANKRSLLVFFATPLFLIMFANMTLFVIAARNIFMKRVSARKYLQHQNHLNITLYARLFIVIGLSWLLGFLANVISHPVLWYLFSVLNSLQGFLICVSFVTTRKVLSLVKESLGLLSFKPWSENYAISLPSTNRTTLSVITIENSV